MEHNTRWKELTLVLQFDSQYEKVLSFWDRVFIHKERLSLEYRKVERMPPEVEQKVQDILHRIKQIKWKPFLES